jgi:hypothetical protein
LGSVEKGALRRCGFCTGGDPERRALHCIPSLDRTRPLKDPEQVLVAGIGNMDAVQFAL